VLTLCQTIEARALNLLASTPEILSAQAASRISVPRVLLHDTENHVLIMTDLGTGLLTLDEWLIPALSNSPAHDRTPPPDADACRDVGMRVGQFLAAIHSMDMSSIDSERFVNEDTRRLVKELVIDKMGEAFERFGYTGAQAQGWCATIADEFEAGVSGGRGVFSMGDLWTGSILVNADGSMVGLVDWEFAGEARPLQDIAQLCASHFLSQTPEIICQRGGLIICVGSHIRSLLMSLPSSSTSKPPITAFTHALQTAYREHTRAANPPWFRDPTSRDAAIKSAWILHGREMVNNAGERYLGICVALGAEEGEAEEMVRCMVKCGIGYLCGPQVAGNKWNGESFLTMFCLEDGDDR
jgi:hypothetical protein